jgi:hypothetical protein
LLAFTLLFILAFTPPALAQTPVASLTLQAEAGFDGYFRPDSWFPIYVRIANDSGDVRGRLVVRPATSGAALQNAYSTPVDLPAGARQSATLYVTASDGLSQLRVELIDEQGIVVASAPANVRRISPPDRLSVVITNAVSGAVDLGVIRSGSASGIQALMAVADLPDRAGLFDAVNVLLFNDVDSGELTAAQRTMLAEWVTRGGHLLVTGGGAWQATAAGLSDLLPLRPTSSVSVNNLAALSAWIGGEPADTSSTLLTIGDLTADADVLLAADDGTPLIARRTHGAGIVDYLAFDPNAEPVRDWAGQTQMWYTLASAAETTQPSWAYGFARWDAAAQSVEILPGLDLLLDWLPLCGFLAVYIALIGPVNYFVLNRINRREWAWLTIPIFIAIFSVLAFVFGNNLRGTDAVVSRLAVVQSWTNSEQARMEGVIGILSPRRADYALTTPGAVLRPLPLPRFNPGGLLAVNSQISSEIEQSDVFTAGAFTIDSSFFARFTTEGSIPRPALGGQATISDDRSVAGQMVVRGAVVNETDFVLQDAVILARGVALQLEGDLAPGDVRDFELTLPGQETPNPTLYYASPFGTFNFYSGQIEQTIADIMGPAYDQYLLYNNFTIDEEAQAMESRRRQLFLQAFVRDLPGAINAGTTATMRGDSVYLIGWTDSVPMQTELTGADWRAQDTTLYIAELDVERVTGTSDVLITPDRFTWSVPAYTGTREMTPVSIQLDVGDEVVFRYTPIATARLAEVDELTVMLRQFNTGTRTIPIALWDWAAGEWIELDARQDRYTVPQPARFIGPMNAVQVRLRAEDLGNFMMRGQLSIEQRGRF